MGYVLSKNGKVLKSNLPRKLPKDVIDKVDNNPSGDAFVKSASNTIQNSKIVFAFDFRKTSQN